MDNTKWNSSKDEQQHIFVVTNIGPHLSIYETLEDATAFINENKGSVTIYTKVHEYIKYPNIVGYTYYRSFVVKFVSVTIAALEIEYKQ